MQVSGSGGAAQAAQTQQWRDRLFQRADSDRSGRLSLDEFSQLATRGRGGPAANSAASAADPTGASAGSQAGSSIADMFNRLDSDGDGSLSKAELETRPSASPPRQGGGFDSATFAALLGVQGNDAAPGQGRNSAGRQHRDRDAEQGAAAQGGSAEATRLAHLAAYQARQQAAAVTASPLAAGTARSV